MTSAPHIRSYDARFPPPPAMFYTVAGKIRGYGHCVSCDRGWESDGSAAPVCGCGLPQPRDKSPTNPRPGDVYIDLAWDGAQLQICCDRQRQGFRRIARFAKLDRMETWRVAQNTLGAIRSEIQAGNQVQGIVFRPENYRRKAPEGLIFSHYAAAVVDRWEKDPDPRRRRKPSYREQVRGYLRNHLVRFGRNDIREIWTPQILGLLTELEQAISERTDDPLSSKTIANVMGFVRAILKHAARKGDRSTVPEFPEFTVDEPTYETFTPEESEAILAVAHPGDLPIFTTLADAPIRPGEARACHVEDFDEVGRRLWICRTWSLDEEVPRRKSGGGAYWAPLTQRATERIAESLRDRGPLEPDAYLFVTPKKKGRHEPGRPYPRHLADMWKALCRKAGIEYRAPYKLKHSWGQDAVDAGADLYSVRDVMGHKDVRSTERYAKRSPEAMRRTLKLVESRRASTGETQAKQIRDSRGPIDAGAPA